MELTAGFGEWTGLDSENQKGWLKGAEDDVVLWTSIVFVLFICLCD
jgi:hypothetical protein